MIWLLDLDNTLVGRAEALEAWASGEVDRAALGPADLAAILAADEGGHGSKEALARVLIARLGWDDDVPAAIRRFRAGILDGVRVYDGVLVTLDVLRNAGHRVAVVTNGTSAQQRGKVARCGLEAHVDAIVVSEEEGVAKPDPRLLEVALERLGAADADRRQVWMVGDAAHADVAAGRAAGTRTAWVSHGRSWDGPGRPDVVAPTTREAIALAADMSAALSGSPPGAVLG
ncbi:HAD family hydrolase [Isoptericola sp. NPDC058082]|uniref:HAD family hydrolase n=1 Tax=Isoptericola sp. NPDC058082 TaxID=3346331 RepID=UPI0036E9D972